MLILNVKVIPSASKDMVKEDKGFLKVYVMKPAVEGKANQAMINLFADKFKVSKSSIEIVRGEHSSRKTVRIIHR